MPILEAKNISYYYNKGLKTEVAATKDISFSIEKGDFLGIIGHTGSGKSTLIQHFNGLIKPDEGMILIDGEDIFSSKERLRAVRFQVGLVFQYPEHQLFEESVFRDIAFGPKNMKLKEAEINERVEKAIDFVGLSPDLLEKSPFDLSGGQKRRAAIAGVMAMEPKILVLDEVAAGLDPRGRDEILEQISAYHKRTGATIIMVSHNMEDIAKYANKVLVLNKGGVETIGTPDEIFAKAERLEEIGLELPVITNVFKMLKEKGLNVPENIYEVSKARDIILELIKKEVSENA